MTLAMETAVLENLEGLNYTKSFLGTADEITAVAETLAPHSVAWVKALSDDELFPLGERALQDIADDILVLNEIRQRFRRSGFSRHGYVGWKDFVEKNSRYSLRTVQRRLTEVNGVRPYTKPLTSQPEAAARSLVLTHMPVVSVYGELMRHCWKSGNHEDDASTLYAKDDEVPTCHTCSSAAALKFRATDKYKEMIANPAAYATQEKLVEPQVQVLEPEPALEQAITDAAALAPDVSDILAEPEYSPDVAPTPKTPPYLCAICNEEFYSKALADEHSHQGADGSITSSIVCAKAPRESYAWRKQEFGEDCEQRHETISKRLLAILCDKFSDIHWGGWAPWRPTMDSQTKAGHVPVEDRYRVTLYLTAEQVAQLPDFRHGTHD